MYNDIEKMNNRNSFSQLTYLIGGNSDKFNDLVKEDTLSQINEEINTSTHLSRASISTNEDTIKDELSHEEFLTSYTIDFFEYIFGKDVENSLYDVKNATVQKLYQKDVLSKLYVKDKVEIFNSDLSSNIFLNNVKCC